MAYKRYNLNASDNATIVSKDLGITSDTNDYRTLDSGNVKDLTPDTVARTGRIPRDIEEVTFNFDTMSIYIKGKTITVDFRL